MIKIRINLCLVFFILITATGLIFPFKSYAVPASPRIFELEQPDGTVFYARQWGDEWAHGMETTDGHSIVLDRSTKKWTYAVIDKTGKLVASKRIVGTDYPPFDTPIRPTGEARAMIRQLRASAVSQRVVPPTGTANVPVILINFNGTSYTYSSGDFDTLLFGTGSKSMKDYYDEVSYGNFSVSAGISGIAGWYTAANIHDYYGTNVSCSGTTYDQHVAELVIEAVNAADSAGFNFDPYDQDNDCYVDIVGIVHQGTGEETGGPSTDIWSHSWNLKSALSFCGDGTGAVTTNANCSANPTEKIKVNDYIIMPELYDTSPTQSTIGVFAHEYGHALGLPDLYDTDWPTDSSGIGDWGVMASGSWNAVVLSGDTPAHTSAWSKYFLGWVTPTQVITTLTNEQIDAASGNSDVYQLLNGTSTAGEYFLVENRQRTGFDAGLPGDGLLIWHIDAGQQNNNNECVDHSNCPVNHYRVALEQADNLWDLENNQNRGDAGDPFPGTQANIAFTDSTDPDSYLYNGNASNVSVTAISTSQTNMTATLIPGPPPAAPSGLSAAAVSSSRIDLSWTDNSNNEVGFKIERKTTAGGTYSQIASVGVNVTTFPSTGLSASTEYYYRVRAYNLVGDSAWSNEANATTGTPPDAPILLSATAVSSSAIDLSWQDNSIDEDGFKIERKTGAGGTYSEIATVLMNITTYSNTGLSASTEYFYQVKAYNAQGDSLPSNELSATTNASSGGGSSSSSSGDGGGGGGCFIASAAYGSYMADEVMVLREFRDKYLLTNSLGREFVGLYYAYSPPIAEVIKGNEFLRTVTRAVLTPVVMGVVYPYRSLAVFIVFLTAAIALRIKRKRALTV